MMTELKKPIIRHCYNCEWCDKVEGWCGVKYEYIFQHSAGKRKARFCRFFAMKEGGADET